MPSPLRKYRLGARQRLAFHFLADIPFGVAEIDGFARETIVRLARVGPCNNGVRESLSPIEMGARRLLSRA
jgi:hypothetical protein